MRLGDASLSVPRCSGVVLVGLPLWSRVLFSFSQFHVFTFLFGFPGGFSLCFFTFGFLKKWGRVRILPVSFIPTRRGARGRRERDDGPRRGNRGRGRPRRGGGGARAPRGFERRARARVERYGSRATVSFESLNIRIPLKFCQNSAKLSQFSAILKI